MYKYIYRNFFFFSCAKNILTKPLYNTGYYNMVLATTLFKMDPKTVYRQE